MKHPKSLPDCQDFGLRNYLALVTDPGISDVFSMAWLSTRIKNYSSSELDVVVVTVEGEASVGRIEFF